MQKEGGEVKPQIKATRRRRKPAKTHDCSQKLSAQFLILKNSAKNIATTPFVSHSLSRLQPGGFPLIQISQLQ